MREDRRGRTPRRLALTAAGVLVGTLGLTGCGTSAESAALPTSMTALVKQAKKEGEVDWVVPKPQEQMQPAIDLFEKKYPGIKVKYTNTKPGDEVSQLKVEQAAKKVSIDVGNAGGLSVTPSATLAADTDWSKYGIDDENIFAENFVYVWATPKVWAYNTDKVKPADVPKTWDDLLGSAWSDGRISAESRASFLAAWHLDPSMGDKKALAWAEKFAAQEPHYSPDLSQAEAPIESGQVSIGTSLANQVLAAKDKGAPVDIAPISPTSANESYVFVPKGAPHPAAGALLTSFLSSEEAQSALAKTYNSRIPVTTDCADPDGIPVLQAVCKANLKWFPTSTLRDYNSLSSLFTKAEKVLGTNVS
ncbi:ABC transporter substrate-binding protein [Streptomyces sp. NPDC050264]|uniref:ABC transporter substrate-binding protein n=1 Tax=Streptomyces sp. NPDC050264 TaxID=3155038 RepID=UPI00341DA675